MPINIEEAYRAPNGLDQKGKYSIIIKTLNVQKKNIKAAIAKVHVTCKGIHIRIIPSFSTETLKARKPQSDFLQTLQVDKYHPRLLYYYM